MSRTRVVLAQLLVYDLGGGASSCFASCQSVLFNSLSLFQDFQITITFWIRSASQMVEPVHFAWNLSVVKYIARRYQ